MWHFWKKKLNIAETYRWIDELRCHFLGEIISWCCALWQAGPRPHYIWLIVFSSRCIHVSSWHFYLQPKLENDYGDHRLLRASIERWLIWPTWQKRWKAPLIIFTTTRCNIRYYTHHFILLLDNFYFVFNFAS